VAGADENLSSLALRALTMAPAMARRKFLEQMNAARGRALDAALTASRGDVARAAAALGVTRQYVYLILRTEFPPGALARYQRKKGHRKG
jgi:transcriptional regulator of acetoin/glycerol metabolism